MEGIGDLREPQIGLGRRDIEGGGPLHAESFMRPFGVEVLDEDIELGLLLKAVHACM
jgi:hypothetical protein